MSFKDIVWILFEMSPHFLICRIEMNLASNERHLAVCHRRSWERRLSGHWFFKRSKGIVEQTQNSLIEHHLLCQKFKIRDKHLSIKNKKIRDKQSDSLSRVSTQITSTGGHSLPFIGFYFGYLIIIFLTILWYYFLIWF